MLAIKNSSHLNIISPNTNKVFSLITKDLENKEIKSFSNIKDLKSLLYSLFKQKQFNSSSNNYILQLIKNNPTLKNIGDISITIKELLTLTKDNKDLSYLDKLLKSFATNINDSKNLNLQQKFQNSGIFLESKLKYLNQDNYIKDILTNDLKSVLLKTNNNFKNTSHEVELTKHIDKLLLQIDYHQLISYITDSSSLFIPFSWDLLKKGDIQIKNLKNNKFFCDINLTLKEYGELNLKLTLYEKNQLNIHIYSNNKNLKKLIKENISTLRSALIELNIIPKEIKTFTIKENLKSSPYQDIDDNLNLGFEAKA